MVQARTRVAYSDRAERGPYPPLCDRRRGRPVLRLYPRLGPHVVAGAAQHRSNRGGWHPQDADLRRRHLLHLTLIKGGRFRMTGQNDVIAFDPRGVVETEPLELAARVGGLDGLRLGVLDNTKWNAGRLLRKTVARLQGEFSFAAVNYYRKESFSKDADPAVIATIAADNDIVVTAIGD